MKYEHLVYTTLTIILTTLRVTVGSELRSDSRGGDNHRWSKATNLERIISAWNKSAENNARRTFIRDGNSVEEEVHKSSAFGHGFPSELSKCIENYQFQITGNYTSGKNIILNCFKTIMILNILSYLGGSPKSEIKFFNGMLELKKIPKKSCVIEGDSTAQNVCSDQYRRNFGDSFEKRKNDYVEMYKNTMEKLVSEKNRVNEQRTETAEKKENLLEKIQENSQKYLSEVARNLDDEEAEKVEEEKLKRELADPKLLSLLDAFSRNYMLKLMFYPGVSARMMRGSNGGITFDLEMTDSSEEEEEEEEEGEEEEREENEKEEGENYEEGLSDEGSTREIKHDGPQAKDYVDDSDEETYNNNKKKRKKGKKGNKKKQKEKKKKAKKLKKILPYLMIPIMIQLTLLPFVFKKLFFLAMKALFAGKMALILVGFNMLRYIFVQQNDEYTQKIRVEHYGYGKGEEYGAWINGRSLGEPLNWEPYRGQKPLQS